jgi:hypothetical protein
VSLSEEATGSRRGKENIRMKNIETTYLYMNII